jgi:hypothetical protein
MISIRPWFLALTAVFPGVVLSNEQAAAQTVHYVDNLGDCEGLAPCYPAIMDAVTAAVPSDSIEVFPGVYHEAVVFDGPKDHITLRARAQSVAGEALRPVIVAPNPTITLLAQGVQMRNFVIEGGVLAYPPGTVDAVLHGNVIGNAGVYFFGCARSTVTENSIVGGFTVAATYQSSRCVFEDNTVDGDLGIGGSDHSNRNTVVRRNVVRGGSISFPPAGLYGARIESNRVEGGRILLSVLGIDETLIRYNVVRGGGIELRMWAAGPMGRNRIEANFVSGSAGDGISIYSSPFYGGDNLITGNTSVDNAGCDLKDDTPPGAPHQNTWKNNRFRTKCGIPDE